MPSPMHRHHAEEAVEDEQEERDDEQAGDGGASRPPRASPSPSVAEMARLVERRERDGQRAGLQHERQVLRLLERCRCPVIWAPFEPLIPFGYCSKSIDGHDLISRSSTIAKSG